jgi:hypothetical protein
MTKRLKTALFVLVLGFVSGSHARAQSRESWWPEDWSAPTPVPRTGSNRVLLYRPDSARTALLALAAHVTHQGLVVEELTARHVQTQRFRLPDSLRFTGGAGMELLATTLQAFPAVLLVRGTGTPNLRRLQRLSGVSRTRPEGHGHKLRYPQVVGQQGGVSDPLAQAVFDRMVIVLRSYPADRLMYINR